MADRVPDSTASIRRGLNQHGCERIVLPSLIRVQSTKLIDISFVAYTDGLCPLCMVYQMAKEFATRRYQLTINNPKEHGFDHDTIKAILAKGAKLLYWCMSDEEGKEETYHTHLYLVFCNAVMFKTLKNKFPTAHIEVPQWGTNSENYAYIRKEGTKYHKDANGHYEYTDAQGKVHVGTNFSDTFEESGDLPPDAKQGDRNDLRMLYKLIASGEDNAQILGEHPEYLRDISHIDRTRQTILEEKYRNVFRRMNVTYISGPTGVGKTRSVREGCGYANCYSVSDYKHPFDGYRGQAAILFDEFHNSLPLVNMLQYLDGYPLELPCRYANKQACYTEVYLVSNLPLERQYRALQDEKPETWAAFLRRINTVRIFAADGSHKDYSTDDYFRECVKSEYELVDFSDNRTRIESALNVTILSITQGSNNQLFELRVVAGCNLMGRLIPWADTYMDDSDTKIVLGINAAGIPVCIDFGQLPHWLLAAATGMGKTQLVLLILHQLTQKGYVIYLADYKGVDFGSEYRKPGHYADNDADLEQMLDSVVRELNRRRTEFSIAGCANLEEYVRTTGDDLHRIVVILDETSMILDTTGRDKEGKAAISVITNKLLAIGRLGRALGIHLLVATQRPDVGSVPGSLKAQLDGRICGHTADAQSSIVILDDGSAANLPAIPGRFIIRNGSETDDIVQAYYYHK